jgi:5'-nucleotidase
MNSETRRRLKRVLVTNDDGIDAPGLKVAQEVAASIAEEVWTVAPATDFSGGSRVITLHEALRLNSRGDRRFALTGSPADCMFVAIGSLLKENKPDLVLSGVNAGVNIGGDVGFSGTVGAAMTALSLGVPAIAMSQAWKDDRDRIPWDTARQWLPRVVHALLDAEGWPWNFVPNINVPAVTADEVKGIEVTQQGHSAVVIPTVELRVDLRNQDYYWIYMHKENDNPKPDEDIAALRRNAVSVTPLGVNITDAGGIEELGKVFG